MRVAKTAAIVAAAGIIASILVIGTPAITTLRIAAKDLVSPSEGVSWMDLSQPTRNRLEKAIAWHPGDWKLQLVHARRLYAGGRPWQAIEEGETSAARMRDFEQVIANAPKEAAPRAAYVRWLFQQNWDYLHPTQAEERARILPATRRGEEAPHPATRLGLVDAAEGQLTKLSKLDPDNAAWSYLLASCRFARLDDAGGIRCLKEAAAKPRFSLRHRSELDATVDAYASLGIPRPEASVELSVQMLFPELADMRKTARIASALADKMEAGGRLREAAEIRTALIDVGRLMRHDSEYMIPALVGNAIVAIGYGKRGIETQIPHTGPEAGWRAAEARRAIEREESFLRFLSAAGMGTSAPRYAHGLEEGLAHAEAATPFTEGGGNSWEDQVRLLGIAYAVSPLGWFVLASAVGALIVVAAIAAVLRRKGARPGSRTVVGVSIAGGIAAFCVLALSAVLAVLFPYGFGLLDEATGACRDYYT
jgi:hypothetical protein